MLEVKVDTHCAPPGALRRESPAALSGRGPALAALAPRPRFGEKAAMSTLRIPPAARAAKPCAAAPRWAAWAGLCVLAGALSACSSARQAAGFPDQVQEGAEVEAAPWPRLVDSPAPVDPLGEDRNDLRRRGELIEEELGEDAKALDAASAALLAEPVVRGDLGRDAAQVRRRGAALEADGAGAAPVRLNVTPAGAPEAIAVEAEGAASSADDLDAETRALLESIAAEARSGAEAGSEQNDAVAPTQP